MKRILHIVLLLLILSAVGSADASAQWRKGIRSLYLFGSPNVQLNLDMGMQGDEAIDEDDSTILFWGRGSSHSKITVSTFSPDQQFDLFVEAANVSGAKSTGKVKLIDGMQDTNLLTNVNKNNWGSARIVYSAMASVENGNTDSGLSDVHTITYTITDM